jgi:hypothetical protein
VRIRNTEENSWIHCCNWKAIGITYSKCVFVAVGVQCAKWLRRFILSPVACPAIPYFSPLSYKRQDFRKKNSTEYKMCASIFSTTFLFRRHFSL